MKHSLAHSSNLAAAHVEGDDLIVEFQSGAIYRYKGAATHLPALLEAHSPGKYLAENIKGVFDYRKE